VPESLQQLVWAQTPGSALRFGADAAALLVSVLASLIGLLNSFGMRRLPDIAPAALLEGTVLG
jgi:hypothetical protein